VFWREPRLVQRQRLCRYSAWDRNWPHARAFINPRQGEDLGSADHLIEVPVGTWGRIVVFRVLGQRRNVRCRHLVIICCNAPAAMLRIPLRSNPDFLATDENDRFRLTKTRVKTQQLLNVFKLFSRQRTSIGIAQHRSIGLLPAISCANRPKVRFWPFAASTGPADTITPCDLSVDELVKFQLLQESGIAAPFLCVICHGRLNKLQEYLFSNGQSAEWTQKILRDEY